MVGYNLIKEVTAFTTNKIALDHSYFIGKVEIDKTTTGGVYIYTDNTTPTCSSNTTLAYVSGTNPSWKVTSKTKGKYALCVFINTSINYLLRVSIYELLYADSLTLFADNLEGHIVFTGDVVDQYGNPMSNETVTLNVYAGTTTTPVYSAAPVTDITGSFRHNINSAVYDVDFVKYDYRVTATLDTLKVEVPISELSTGTWDGGGGCGVPTVVLIAS